MLNNPHATLTDSLERELLSQELDYYNDTPLATFFRWVGAGIKGLQAKLVSVATKASTGLGGARPDTQKATTA